MTIRLSFMVTCVLAAAILALVTSPARSTDFTWDGELSRYWGDEEMALPKGFTTNWDHEGQNNPIPNDNVFFSGPSPNTNINLNEDRRVLSVNFSGGTKYWLLGPEKLTLVDGDITASGTAPFEILWCEVALESNGDWHIDNPMFEVGRVGPPVSTSGVFRLISRSLRQLIYRNLGASVKSLSPFSSPSKISKHENIFLTNWGG